LGDKLVMTPHQPFEPPSLKYCSCNSTTIIGDKRQVFRGGEFFLKQILVNSTIVGTHWLHRFIPLSSGIVEVVFSQDVQTKYGTRTSDDGHRLIYELCCH